MEHFMILSFGLDNVDDDDDEDDEDSEEADADLLLMMTSLFPRITYLFNQTEGMIYISHSTV